MKRLNTVADTLGEAIKAISEEAPEYFRQFEGEVFLINDNPSFWQRRIQAPTKLTSKLKDRNVLGFHVLSEIKNGTVWNMDTMKIWYGMTLANVQTKGLDGSLADDVIKQLEKWKMLTVDEKGAFKLTALGMVPATMYLWPSDVYHWSMGLYKLDQEDLWDNDLALSYVLGTTPSIQLDYVPRAEQEEVDEYTEMVRDFLAKAYTQSVMAKDLYNLMTLGKSHPRIRNFQYDVERMQGALLRLKSIYKWNDETVLDTIGIRIKYGINQNLVELCSLPSVGAARAKKLYDAGIKTLKDVKKSKSKISKLIGSGIAMQIFRSFEDDKHVNY